MQGDLMGIESALSHGIQIIRRNCFIAYWKKSKGDKMLFRIVAFSLEKGGGDGVSRNF